MGLTTGIGGSSRLARLEGRSTAAEMVLTGDPMSVRRLYDLGAVNRLVAPAEALKVALEMASMLAAKSPAAMAALKRILAVNDCAPLDEALRVEQEIFQSVVVTDSAKEGMELTQSQYDEAAASARE